MKKILLIVALFLLIVNASPALAKAKKTAAKKQAVKIINIESGNLFFKPAEIRLKHNEKVKLVIKNKGGHTFTVDELDLNIPLKKGSATKTFVPKKKGTFTLYCSVSGHKAAGMVGKVIVE